MVKRMRIPQVKSGNVATIGLFQAHTATMFLDLGLLREAAETQQFLLLLGDTAFQELAYRDFWKVQ